MIPMSYKAARLAQLAAVKERPATPGAERVIWQVTRACDLCCAPCRSEVFNQPGPRQLSLEEGLELIEQVRRIGQPQLVLTGGDPLKRPDLATLVLSAHRLGLPVSLTLSGTPRTTPRLVGLLKAAGLDQITFCLDGPDEATHDGFRHVKGSFRWTLDGVRVAQAIGLPIGVETSVMPDTVDQLGAVSALVGRIGARHWQVTFGNRPERDPGCAFTPELHADTVRRLSALQGTLNYRVRITPASYFLGNSPVPGCTSRWRALELFIGDDGAVERWNTGLELGNVRTTPLAELVALATAPRVHAA
jgi:MoaA/NifB/PqqE/SkfB family radical SAM enzyme